MEEEADAVLVREVGEVGAEWWGCGREGEGGEVGGGVGEKGGGEVGEGLMDGWRVAV